MVDRLQYRSLKRAGISEETCRFFGYGLAKAKVDDEVRSVQVAPYLVKGKVVAQHWRFLGDDGDKDFCWRGSTKKIELFGQHLWDQRGKRILVITEGEKDALSYAEVSDRKWAVVSIPNGSDAAAKDIKRNLEWCSQYEKVVLMFDSDEAGQEAAVECAQLFKPGQAAICKLPLKDANEMLLAGQGDKLKWAPWNAEAWTPDEITGGSKLLEEILNRPKKHALPYHYPKLHELTLGCRAGEIVAICAGTGVGKSEITKQIAFNFRMEHDEKVGYVALEESALTSAVDLLGLEAGERLRLTIDDHEPEEIRKLYERVIGVDGQEMFHFWRHFGSLESAKLLHRIRYMVQGLDCRTIVLDHISIAVSGLDSQNERKDIDVLMTSLRSMVEELGFRCIIVSHLKRLDKGSHEEGARVSLSHLRGSGSIAQISDIVIGAERNQQSETKSNLTRLRVLKNRWTGRLGPADLLHYDHETGKLTPRDEQAAAFEEDDDDDNDYGF